MALRLSERLFIYSRVIPAPERRGSQHATDGRDSSPGAWRRLDAAAITIVGKVTTRLSVARLPNKKLVVLLLARPI